MSEMSETSTKSKRGGEGVTTGEKLKHLVYLNSKTEGDDFVTYKKERTKYGNPTISENSKINDKRRFIREILTGKSANGKEIKDWNFTITTKLLEKLKKFIDNDVKLFAESIDGEGLLILLNKLIIDDKLYESDTYIDPVVEQYNEEQRKLPAGENPTPLDAVIAAEPSGDVEVEVEVESEESVGGRSRTETEESYGSFLSNQGSLGFGDVTTRSISESFDSTEFDAQIDNILTDQNLENPENQIEVPENYSPEITSEQPEILAANSLVIPEGINNINDPSPKQLGISDIDPNLLDSSLTGPKAEVDRYHPVSLELYFGSKDRPNWDLELQTSILNLKIDKEEIVKMMNSVIDE